MNVLVSAARPGGGTWTQLPMLALSPTGTSDGALGLRDAHISLPSGETLLLGATYHPESLAFTLVLVSDARTVLSLSAFRCSDNGPDPSAIVLTPGGFQVSLTLSPAE